MRFPRPLLVAPAVLFALPVLLSALWLFGPAAPAHAANPSPRFDTGLALYSRAGDGQVAQVFGDLAAADRIAVVVPGVDNRLANFWTGHGHAIRRAPAWQAQQLYAQVHKVDPAAGSPSSPGSGTTRRRASAATRSGRSGPRRRRGADEVRGRTVGYRPAAPVTLIGHSYGSVVIGLAARSLGPRVTDIVAIGSPGMGVDRAATCAPRHTCGPAAHRPTGPAGCPASSSSAPATARCRWTRRSVPAGCRSAA